MFLSLALSVAVYPSAPAVPQNLLRLSLVFSTPQAPGVLDRLTLRTASGRRIERAFLEQELRSPDDRIVTVLFHPGRVKTGIRTHDELGMPLPLGDEVTLYLNNEPVRRWHIGPQNHRSPDPRRWRIGSPRSGTREPLELFFERPIDMLDSGLIGVADSRGTRVEGRIALGRDESSWSFEPRTPWSAGIYRVVVAPALEDPEGNAVREPFEESRARMQALDARFVRLSITVR